MTNAVKLAHVLNKWGQPFIQYFLSGKMDNIPLVQMLQNKVISMGLVSPSWSLTKELSPLLDGVSGALVVPFISSYLSKVDDSTIPQMAHQLVDEAIKKGKLTLLEGKIEIEEDDLLELKKYLNWNLPIEESEVYEVIDHD